MSNSMADVTLHVDEETTHDEREKFRDCLMALDGVMGASCNDDRPHLFMVEYDPFKIKSIEFVNAAKSCGFNAELIGI